MGIQDSNSLLGHRVVGTSFEGLVIETIAAIMPNSSTSNFYSTAARAEIDLLINYASGELWAIVIEYSNAPPFQRFPSRIRGFETKKKNRNS